MAGWGYINKMRHGLLGYTTDERAIAARLRTEDHSKMSAETSRVIARAEESLGVQARLAVGNCAWHEQCDAISQGLAIRIVLDLRSESAQHKDRNASQRSMKLCQIIQTINVLF